MNIKCRLNEYRWIKENIANLENRLLEIDTKLQKITNTLQPDKVQMSKDSDKWALLIQKKLDLQELINAEVANGYKEIAKLEGLISELSEREKLLIRYRYIDCLEWELICVKMHYSWRQIHYIHSDALRKLSKTKIQSLHTNAHEEVL